MMVWYKFRSLKLLMKRYFPVIRLSCLAKVPGLLTLFLTHHFADAAQKNYSPFSMLNLFTQIHN